MRYLVVANAHAGGGRPSSQLTAALGDLAGGNTVEVVFTERPGHGRTMVAQRAAEFDVVVAAGGDGTVGEAAAGLLHSGADRPLAILPLGTGNDAAHGAGIGDWSAALAALYGDRERRLDVIDCTYHDRRAHGHRPALIGVGLGLGAAVLTRCTERVKLVLRRWSYHYAAVTTALTYPATWMRLELDEQVLEGRFITVAVANMEYTAGHSVRMAPGAVGDDGRLDVVLVREQSRAARLELLRQAAGGDVARCGGVEVLTARRVRIRSTPPVRLNLDGDLVGTTPAKFELQPGALRVKVP